jgi:tetratricopeptide (TPR) repeat protein
VSPCAAGSLKFVKFFTRPLARCHNWCWNAATTQQLNGVLWEGNVAHTAMSGTGTTSGDDPLQTAVWRLRSRACWADAVSLLQPHTAGASLQRASLLVERCLYTERGWEEAEDALRTAEARADSDEERGAAACERGQLAYTATLHGVHDRADEARVALGRAAALIPPGAPGRALLDFRRGLLAENLAHSPQAARAAYQRAHTNASAQGDELLLSFTWRHLAGLALREGEVAEARHGFGESLRIREKLGYLVGTAPALASLADAESEPEAGRLRAEAGRLFRLLGGVPTWLARQLAAADPSPGSATS